MVQTSFMILPPVPIPQPPDSALTPATSTVHISTASPHNAISPTTAVISCYSYHCASCSPGYSTSYYMLVYSRSHCDFSHYLFSDLMHLFFLFNTYNPAPTPTISITKTISDTEPPTFPSDLVSSLFPKDGLHLMGRTWKFRLTNPI